MPERVLVLGAGFGGLELATTLSEELGDDVEVTLVDRRDGFMFGYAKLDVLFGRESRQALLMRYEDIAKPGVRFVQETITAIDAETRRVTTDAGTHESDVLVIALGADYDLDATPGLAGNEFYSVEGAQQLAGRVAGFEEGHAVVGVAGFPIKCPPAPSEAALMLDTLLREKGVRDACRITFAFPMDRPVPPSPEASDELMREFSERDIHVVAGQALTGCRDGAAQLADGSELRADLLLAVPRHRAPQVVADAGLTEDGYVPVDPKTLATRVDGVYAIGDAAKLTIPKAGVFAQGQGHAVAQRIVARIRGQADPGPYVPKGGCYVEFGGGRVARVDIEFRDGEKIAEFKGPSTELKADKQDFGALRRARWFG